MRTLRNLRIGSALSEWHWPAIAAGVVVALALQILLLWLGSAFALTLGDEQPEGGFALWTVLVQLGAVFFGAAFAAYLARADGATDGAAVGAFTWALALVIGGAVASRPLEGWRPSDIGAAAWTTFLGALLSLATAMIGGAFGARRAHHVYADTAASPMEPLAR